MADPTPKPDAPAPPAPPSDREYFVFEVMESKGGVPTKLEIIGTGAVVASTEKDARWAAIDASPEHKKRTEPDGTKQGPGVLAVAVSARSVGEPKLTVEKVELKKSRT